MTKPFVTPVGSLFAVLIFAAAAHRLLAAENVEAELLRLEQVWNDAHLHGDANALDRLCDERIVIVVPKMELIGKKAGLGMLRSGRMTFSRYETSDLSVRSYGDTAIVTGRLERTRKIQERELQDDWRFTKVYVRQDGKWRIVLWQASDWPG
jgi:ketosteroid isomerase-like protein